MVVIASRHIFGGGPYSVAGSAQLRIVGNKRWPISQISIARKGPTKRLKNGHMRNAITPPYLPDRITDPYHPTGNSVGYMIQTAHLMGCDPIYLLGFTLDSGTGYFFGRDNPVTKKRSLYDADMAMDWLTWYRNRYPGRVKLWPGWQGPIYDVLEVLDVEEAQVLAGVQPRHEPEAQSRDDEGVEQLRPLQEDQPVHPDGG